jgi:hypothetical protein
LSFVIIGLLVVGSGVGMGTMVARGLAQLGEIRASIREQEGIEVEVREEKKKLREGTEQAKRDLGEIPDSLGTTRSAFLMGKSFNLAKTEAMLDQKALRTERRLRYLERERRAVKDDLVRWSVAFAVVEFVLIGGVVVLGRRMGRRGDTRISGTT